MATASILRAAASAFLLAALGCAAAPSAGEADLVVLGGLVRTGDADAPTAEAVAARDGEIVYVGREAGARALIGDETRVVDLDGATLFPGFVDAHAHLLGVGMRARTLDLSEVGSIAELVEVVRVAAAETPAGETLVGRGWLEAEWPEGRFPTIEDIEPVSEHVAVVLTRADGHAMLLNSLALIYIWVNETVPDPPGGRYERFEDGRLTGLLVDAAMDRARGLSAEPSGAARDDVLAEGAAAMAARGWTGVHNMSVPLADAEALARLSGEGRVGLRVYNAINPVDADALIATGPRVSADGRVTTRAVKIYIDGALGSRGAALFADYADDPGNSGLLLSDEAETGALFAGALDADIQISAHAIGDRGNRLALDWMETAFAANADGAADARWRIEHAQIIDPADFGRFAELGVIASMQPSHFATDQFFAPARLGPDRLAGAYAWRSLIDVGAIVVGGSDAPVELGDPLLEFHAAVARSAADGRRAPAFDGSQAVTREEALAMFTSGPAFASFQEDALGAIAVGRRADFSAFSGDLMTVALEEIPSLTPVMTVVDGVVVFDASASE